MLSQIWSQKWYHQAPEGQVIDFFVTIKCSLGPPRGGEIWSPRKKSFANALKGFLDHI